MAASRVCSVPGCPALTRKGRCTKHRREADRARGRRQARGYDADFDRERARWKRILDTRPYPCWRCGELIQVGSPWHLGHDDDRAVIRGPEHPDCNLSAAGKAAHR